MENKKTASPINVNQLPKLHPGKWGKFVYYLFEPFCWGVWYRHRRSINGEPPDSPCVVMANHGSYLDWILLHVILRRKFRRKIQFLAKEKIIRNPLFRVFIRATDSVVVEDAKKTRALVNMAKIFSESPIEVKPIVGIFPEGTRSRNGEPLPAIGGAAWVARKCRVPIVPVALCGFWEAWPPHKRLPLFKRRNLSIHFLPPLNPADFTDDQAAVDSAMNRVYEIVQRERASRLHTNGD